MVDEDKYFINKFKSNFLNPNLPLPFNIAELIS